MVPLPEEDDEFVATEEELEGKIELDDEDETGGADEDDRVDELPDDVDTDELVELRVAMYATPPRAAIRITIITTSAATRDMATTLLAPVRSKFQI